MDRPREPEDYDVVLERRDQLAMHILAPLSCRYLPWSSGAMRPSGVVAVLNEIVLNRRKHIVELGSGVSTFYIGRLLRQYGGRLWTVEHDRSWADLLEQELAGEALDGVVNVVRAPLTPNSSGWPGEDTSWYEPARLAGLTTGQPIDLLVVDGPPAYQAGREHARYPAASHFAPAFAGDYAIILDDIDRPGEQEIMERWERELGITFERRLVDGRIGIGRPGEAYTI